MAEKPGIRTRRRWGTRVPVMEEPTTTTTESADRLDKSAIAKLVMATVLVAAFVVFAAQNAASVDVDFLTWSFSIRRIVLMVVSAAFGIAVWELGGFLWRRRRRQ